MNLSGLLVNYFNPVYVLHSFNPSFDSFFPIGAETRLLLDTTTGLYLQNLFLPIVLSRVRPNDVGLWKIWQGSLLVRDLFLMVATVKTLDGLGVFLAPWMWNWSQLAYVAILAGLIVMRLAFVLGHGFHAQPGNQKRKD